MNRSLYLFFVLLTLIPARSAAVDRHILVAAHRGGYANDKADAAPENSVANVAIAVAKGFDLYETDIQRTKDGVFVIMHNETIDRETTGQGQVSDMTLSDLKALRKRYRDGSVSEEKVATLEELLLAGKGRIRFKADLKPGLVEHFDALAELIHRLGLADEIFIRCSRKEAAEIGRRFDAGTPRVEIMVKVDTAAQVREIATRFSPKTIQINVGKDEVLSPEKSEAIRTAVALGIIVEAHSYSDPAQWEALAEAGVGMFHTTMAEETIEWLAEKGGGEVKATVRQVSAGEICQIALRWLWLPMTITLPDDPAITQMGEAQILLDLACGSYAAGHVSRGIAARMSGLDSTAFDEVLRRRGIPSYDEDRFAEDMETLRDLRGI